MSPVSSKHAGSLSDEDFSSSEPEPVQKQSSEPEPVQKQSSEPEPVQKQMKESGRPVHDLLFPKDEYIQARMARILFRGVKRVFTEKTIDDEDWKLLIKLRLQMNEKEI